MNKDYCFGCDKFHKGKKHDLCPNGIASRITTYVNARTSSKHITLVRDEKKKRVDALLANKRKSARTGGKYGTPPTEEPPEVPSDDEETPEPEPVIIHC